MLLLRKGREGTLMLSDQKRTHPEKPTLGSNEASPDAKALVEALQNVLRNEEAWYIAEAHIRKIRGSIEEQYRQILEDSKKAGEILSALVD